jgi:hypothetical protein
MKRVIKFLNDLAHAALFVAAVAAVLAFASCCYYWDHLRFYR